MSISQNFPTTSPSLSLNFARSKILDPRITFSRSSIGTYVDENGIIKTAVANEPRFDHNPTTLESLGLLIEESRYNICSYSEDFSNSYWSSPTSSSGGSFTITSNSETSPDGTLTADKCVMQVGATSVNYQYWYIKNSGYSPNGTDRWIWSFYVKSAGAPIVTIGGQHGGDRQWSFNLSTGLPVSNYGTTGDSYQYMGNGWYRLSLGWVPTLGAYGSPGVNFGCSGVTGDGNVGIYMWGAQLEKGNFLTSYIPTPSTTVITRNADLAYISQSGMQSWYNNTQGTIFSHSIGFRGEGGIAYFGSNTEGWGVYQNSAFLTSKGRGSYTPDTASDSSIAYNTSRNIKAAISINDTTNLTNYVVNGNIIGNGQTRSGPFTYPTGLGLAQADVSGSSQVVHSLTLNKIIYYPVSLSSTQLQNLTR